MEVWTKGSYRCCSIVHFQLNELVTSNPHVTAHRLKRETIESLRFEHENEDEALCFRHDEIFKLFRLQLGRDDEVDCNNIVTPSLSRI